MPNSHSPPQPPVPFADFEFTFDPAMSNLFPHPPPLPSSADLFSPAETTDLLGFLDNFNWDIENPESHHLPNDRYLKSHAPYSNPHLHTSPDPSTSNVRLHSARQLPSNFKNIRPLDASDCIPRVARGTPSEPSPALVGNDQQSLAPRSKPLLSTPQKRLNHIMSEQKRRNAIRDGYAQLIALLAPAGSAPGIGMPTRGRPKGSGSRGKGRTKGKSGVLFRAVEYCRWLEEGRDALREEVLRVEAAAGIQHH